MTDEELEELEERTPDAGREAYYEACTLVLRATFMRLSEAVKDIPFLEIAWRSSAAERDQQRVPGAAPHGAWYPLTGKTLPPGRTTHPTPWIEGTGFRLVEVARGAYSALIAFQWQETGDEIYVLPVDLREFAERKDAAGMVSTLVLSHMMEWLRPRWYERRQVQRIRGFTFVE